MKTHNSAILAALALCLAAVPASAKGNTGEVKGEVVELRQGVRLENRGGIDQLTLRTRDGATHRLLMGRTDGCPDCVAVGDRVRARLVQGGSQAEPGRVQAMKVRRTGETLTFRNERGDLLRTTTRSQDRARLESSAGGGTRSRVETSTQATGGGSHGHQGGAGGGRHR
jgi:hypothetical protein